MKPGKLLRQTLLLLFSGTCILLNTSCNHNSPGDKTDSAITIDSANPVIVVDSTKMSIAKSVIDTSVHPMQEIPSIAPGTNPPKIVFFTKENFSGESDSILLNNYFKGETLTLTAAQLTKFSTTGIRSIKVPFGICADILYATNTFRSIPVANPLKGPGLMRRTISVLQNIEINKYYSPGDYPTIESSLITPTKVTIYPWTDFYFSTDDPSVPSQIQYIGVKYTTNGQGYSSVGPDSVKLSSTKDVYTKSYSYQVPEGRKVNVWLATGNGSYSWSHKIDNTNRLTVNLNINNNAIFAPRNWVGVRASLQ